MGNHSTKEKNLPPYHAESARQASDTSPATGRTHLPMYAARSGRGSRPDLSIFGLSSSSYAEVYERRETKQEREARKLEKDRAARLSEREMSIKEEHVDGGYLVTMGVYTGVEDFSKGAVRQLMIERRIAPFWRGLNEYKEDWTADQLIAAGRGEVIPTINEIPQKAVHSSLGSDPATSNDIQSLMVPISSRSHSAASEASTTPSPHAFISPSSPLVPVPLLPERAPSPFRPRSKTLASLTTPSKFSTPNDLLPREISLPNCPLVNGLAIEIFLYKDAEECPICFLSYPPYLNKTRCCDQPICSECFVQIKRPDPHPPEHHDPSESVTTHREIAPDLESLVSEPACCPYCQQQELGVTYEPPPFRRGLSYAAPALGSYSPAMSSTSSLHSTTSPPLASHGHKRRTTSISANSSIVITTDRIRPDWATKLANARSHLARRSAAATALHTAAYLIGNGTADSRSFAFSGRGRFGRNRGESSPGTSGAGTPSLTLGDNSRQNDLAPPSGIHRAGEDTGSSRRRSRIDDLEDMMMMEAIRLSLVAEEERKRKADKESFEDAKRKAKLERKQERDRRGVYGSKASSASSSALSLSLPNLGRRRGNSGGSALGREIPSECSKSKGKGIDHRVPDMTTGDPSGSLPINFPPSTSSSNVLRARHLETSNHVDPGFCGVSLPSPTAPEKSSHLRHMSTASSPAPSFIESIQGSLRNDFHGSLFTPGSANASGYDIAAPGVGTSEADDPGGSVCAESMFNFRSLAAMIGHNEFEKDDAARHMEHLEESEVSSPHKTVPESEQFPALDIEAATLLADSNYAGLNQGGDKAQQQVLRASQEATSERRIMPETPAA